MTGEVLLASTRESAGMLLDTLQSPATILPGKTPVQDKSSGEAPQCKMISVSLLPYAESAPSSGPASEGRKQMCHVLNTSNHSLPMED